MVPDKRFTALERAQVLTNQLTCVVAWIQLGQSDKALDVGTAAILNLRLLCQTLTSES